MGLVEGGTLIKSNPEGVRRQLGLDLAPTKRLLPELAGNPLKGQSLTFKYYLLASWLRLVRKKGYL